MPTLIVGMKCVAGRHESARASGVQMIRLSFSGSSRGGSFSLILPCYTSFRILVESGLLLAVDEGH